MAIFYEINRNWLVISTPLKNMKVSWDDYSQYMFQTTDQEITILHLLLSVVLTWKDYKNHSRSKLRVMLALMILLVPP
jgi:hypothetical protein